MLASRANSANIRARRVLRNLDRLLGLILKTLGLGRRRKAPSGWPYLVALEVISAEEWICKHAEPAGAIETTAGRPWATVMRVPVVGGVS
jgi:hypothetical protein